MRTLISTGAILFAVCWSFVSAQLIEPITPLIELQSGPLTPGLILGESSRPVHQIRVLVDANLSRGTLVLDGNAPEFDEYGGLVGGIQPPQTRSKGDPQLAAQFECRIELVKEGPEMWHLYRISGPKLRTPLRIATRGSLADSGPARLIVVGKNDKVQAVVECTRYGLAVP